MRIQQSDGWAVCLPGTLEILTVVGVNLTEAEARELQKRWPKSLIVAPSLVNVLALETEPYAIVPPTKPVV